MAEAGLEVWEVTMRYSSSTWFWSLVLAVASVQFVSMAVPLHASARQPAEYSVGAVRETEALIDLASSTADPRESVELYRRAFESLSVDEQLGEVGVHLAVSVVLKYRDARGKPCSFSHHDSRECINLLREELEFLRRVSCEHSELDADCILIETERLLAEDFIRFVDSRRPARLDVATRRWWVIHVTLSEGIARENDQLIKAGAVSLMLGATLTSAGVLGQRYAQDTARSSQGHSLRSSLAISGSTLSVAGAALAMWAILKKKPPAPKVEVKVAPVVDLEQVGMGLSVSF